MDAPPGFLILLGNDYTRPLFNKLSGDRSADPAAATGNYGDFLLQPHLPSFHYGFSVYSSHPRLATES